MRATVWAVFLAVLSVTAVRSATPIPVILDTDIGDDIDDALALSFALRSPELKILAVITVLNDGERRADLVWRILELHGRTDIPVGSGAEQPILARPRTGAVRQTEALAAGYHMPASRRHNGIELLMDTCLRSPEKVTLIGYGPATNIAIALRAEPRLRAKVERIVLMNGVFFRPGLEYNTRMDPEASAIVYGSGLPVTAVGLDVTMQCKLSAEQMQRISGAKLESVQFLYQLIRLWQNGKEDQRPILHDPLAIGVTVRPELVSTVPGSVTVETRGTPDQTYGMTLFHRDPSTSVRVAQEVSAAAFVDFFLDRVLAPPRHP